jgi:hypothetical protein
MNDMAAVTLSNENGPSRFRPYREPGQAASAAQQAAHAPQWPTWPVPTVPRQN